MHTYVEDSPRSDVKVASVAAFSGSFAPNARPADTFKLPWYQRREYFLGGWLDPEIWKAAFIETVGTTCLVVTSGHIAATLMSYGTTQIGAYIGISSIFLLSVFIYATAGLTGGHLNPMVTFSSIITGLCPLSRGTLYICAQTAGSALAGGIIIGIYGRERAVQIHGGGCFYDPSHMSSGQVFLSETFASFVLLYLAYGVGLDPRQALLFGPKFGPLLVGLSVGLVAFATSGMAPGYAGAQMHPARCFAFGIARRNLSGQWIWWFGPALAAVLFAAIYNMVPPTPRKEAQDSSTPTLNINPA
ncbi:related to aquaporin [Cephalotrichum gorgonifer]|uniref:Related to aquaporin n=1 Tax=Cephalotrichum gorgonifer TaxID=2041049 RepID=A0AAE8MN10_9PEZI|nr:related to aquaporin [Cephalotrichum gorgonifer]